MLNLRINTTTLNKSKSVAQNEGTLQAEATTATVKQDDEDTNLKEILNNAMHHKKVTKRHREQQTDSQGSMTWHRHETMVG